ncbi:putative sucrose-phosphate synthase 2 [Morella rubra]|uniref:Putative sucrose-phosphate synthase 2 n=1 Tax=Morella rubra TaxID=262757 RepID=A0A6A1URS2_9ROSI|nr:putative sucrose-phosphate synthase 2 [Morella rubra]
MKTNVTRSARPHFLNLYPRQASPTSAADAKKSSLLLRERGHSSPTRYFVEEVITGFDETDLHRSWLRAASTRSPHERNTRLENMRWRIWNLVRRKKQEKFGDLYKFFILVNPEDDKPVAVVVPRKTLQPEIAGS